MSSEQETQSQIDQLAEQRNNLNADISGYTTQVNDLKKALDAKDAAIKTAQDFKNTYCSDLEQKVRDFSTSLDQLRPTFSNAMAQESQAGSKIDDLDKNLSNSATAVRSAVDALIGRLQKERDAINSSLGSAQKSLESAQQSKESIQQRINDLWDSIH